MIPTFSVEEEIKCPCCKAKLKVTIPVRQIDLSPSGSCLQKDGKVKVKAI